MNVLNKKNIYFFKTITHCTARKTFLMGSNHQETRRLISPPTSPGLTPWYFSCFCVVTDLVYKPPLPKKHSMF